MFIICSTLGTRDYSDFFMLEDDSFSGIKGSAIMFVYNSVYLVSLMYKSSIALIVRQI